MPTKCNGEAGENKLLRKECGAFEQNIPGEKCKYCWSSSIKKKVLDKRDNWTCGRCKGEIPNGRKRKKFFGHLICRKCIKDIPRPLKAYAAMLIESEGLSEEEVISDMVRTFKHGVEQNSLKIGMDHPAEWIYKKTTRTMEPTLTRQTELVLAQNVEMGKDGSHERCSLCGNEHRKRDPLMKVDHCPGAIHQKQCAKINRNYKIPFQCPACKEVGNYARSEEVLG